jgi:hypothetical protein
MPAWATALIGIGWSLTVLALGFAIRVLVKLGQHDAMAQAHGKLLDCIPDMQQDLASLRQNDEVFWKVIGPHMSSIIQSPDHTERDHLIRKLDEDTLTYSEALALSSTLGHAFDDETDKGKKTAFAFKLAQVRCLLLKMDRETQRGRTCQQETSPTPSSSHSR